MDGNYRDQIRQWTDSQIAKIEKGSFYETSHIDEIIDAVSKNDWIDWSIKTFRITIQRVNEIRFNRIIIPMLVFPLYSELKKIRMKPPQSVEDLKNQFSNEPPSIYLQDVSICFRFGPIEEYKCPLNFSLINDPAHFYTYYREHKYFERTFNFEEYSRGVYIEYFPDGEAR
jgi:hypothetical protein